MFTRLKSIPYKFTDWAWPHHIHVMTWLFKISHQNLLRYITAPYTILIQNRDFILPDIRSRWQVVNFWLTHGKLVFHQEFLEILLGIRTSECRYLPVLIKFWWSRRTSTILRIHKSVALLTYRSNWQIPMQGNTPMDCVIAACRDGIPEHSWRCR